ncbi:MAG: glycosyltransferase family 4 protein [Verrucomicrobia bacterium]|nr:glycosyltransferase family 4 protein [Verrucomicrobiota bacterium]MBV8278589.1 glycosyltransferase family 4 protein [Verrucomicrobiota bacterium]
MGNLATKSVEERIRVLHVIDSFDLGGAQAVLLNWLKYHDRSKFAVEIATFHATEQSLFMHRMRELRIPLHVLGSRRWLPTHVFKLGWLVVRNRYSVVHCHLYASNWIGKPIARLAGVPAIIAHDQCNDMLRMKSRLVCLIDRCTNRCADAIIAVAESIKEFLIRCEQIPEAKIHILPNGVAESSSTVSRSAAGGVIGGAGRLTRQKNFHKFLAIARALKALDRKYRFRIAGSGPLQAELKRCADSLGIEVDWLGELTSLDPFFSEIDLFLLTSDFEGLPMVIIECLQRGVPVAATAVDGVREQLADAVLLISPEADIRESARHIHELLSDSEQLSRSIVKGRRLVDERFSAKRQIAEIEGLYLRILAARDLKTRASAQL